MSTIRARNIYKNSEKCVGSVTKNSPVG